MDEMVRMVLANVSGEFARAMAVTAMMAGVLLVADWFWNLRVK